MEKRCSKCILPATFPGVSFDERGICNHCLKYRGQTDQIDLREKYQRKFSGLLERNHRGATYDLILAYSGGKDSTHTLEILVKEYNLRILALTFDNAFIPEQSFKNIAKACTTLGVDSFVIRPSRRILKKIFNVAAHQELYSAKTLERASTICTSCIGLIKAITLRTALEKAIPFVGFGWSPGQAPIQSSVMKTNAAFARSAQKLISEPIRRIVGEAMDPYFVTEEQFEQAERFPWNIHPLAFHEYDEKKIHARNEVLGWEEPDNTDLNSSNCLLNAYANQIHRSRYGFHPYVWEIANLVRLQVMDRDEGLAKIEPPEDEQMVEYARNKLSATT